MGLFDRIKKAFMNEQKPEEKNEPALEENLEADQSVEEIPSSAELNETATLETESNESITLTEAEENQMPTADTSEVTAEEVAETKIEDSAATEIDSAPQMEAEPALPEKNPELAEEAETELTPETASTVEPDTEPIFPATASEKVAEDNAIAEKNQADIISNETDDAVPVENEVAELVEENLAPAIEEPETAVQEKYNKGLEKTRKSFGQRMNELFARFRKVDEEFFEDLEETLIGADVGFDTAMKLTDALRQEVKLQNAKKPAQIQNVIIEKLVDIYEAEGVDENNQINLQPEGLSVILFVGVNGTGKTTSIGKLAHQYKNEGKKVLLAAADTFRAGAIDQLVVWGQRSDVEVVRGNAGGDPAAVVFDAVEKAKNEEYDILLIDTAGRLQNKVNLMKELEKIKRVIQREIPTAPHEVLLVVDATTGQNALVQARQFKETTDLTGLVLTKLDGTAKGGIVLAIRNELHLPVKLVGLGEGLNDLETFNPNDFAVGLFKGLLQAE